MTLGERIRAVRLAQVPKLSQSEFGEITGMTRAQITTYEIDKVVASDSYLRLLSLKFGVSYAWLKTGEGEMFLNAGGDFIVEMASKYQLSDFQQTLVRAVYEMPPDLQRMAVEVARKIAADSYRNEEIDETEHERIERITNQYLDAHDAQDPLRQTDKKA